jgi:hypothetical protein
MSSHTSAARHAAPAAASRQRPFTHPNATGRPRPVCGTDEPSPAPSDAPHTGDRPDGEIRPEVEAASDDAVSGDPHVIEVLHRVAHGHMGKIDGMLVDATTATAILTVYHALNPVNRAKLAGIRIDRMADVAWKLLRPRI